MASKNEELQGVFHKYQEQHGGTPETPYRVVQWALANSLLALPTVDLVGILADDMARALREEYRTDNKGRRYRRNHAAKITRQGIQMTLWADIEVAPYEHMKKAFQQRRRQIVGDCYQLKNDVDVYNDKNTDMPPIQLILNFIDDVAELQAVDGDDEDAA